MSSRVFFAASLVIGILVPVCPAAQTRGGAVLSSRWLNEDVSLIITAKERDVFFSLRSDRERELFIQSFWKQRDPDPATPENEFQAEHYRRLAEADRRFGTADTPGRLTDRGRVYVLLGEPQRIAREPSEAGGPEVEIWTHETRPKDGPPSVTTVAFPPYAGRQAGPLFLERCNMKMRVFEGLAEGQAPAGTAVTASSLRHTVSATIQPDDDLEAQQKRLEQVFNLRSVKMLTETNLVWEKGKLDKAFHFFRVGERTYLVQAAPTEVLTRKFRLEVLEQNDGTKTNLLDTEADFPKNIAAVFGFRDVQGRSYFVSLQILEWYVQGNVPAPPRPAAPAVSPIPAEGPVRAIGEIKPPRLIKVVDPVYPPLARQARVEGVVILEVQADIYGRIQAVKVLRSIPLLDQAAIDAVRQWVYEPAVIGGRPREITFTVTVRFSLSDRLMGPQARVTWAPAGAPVALKAVKEVQPVYPETASRVQAQGTVVLEGTVDPNGKVVDLKILRSVHPALDRAAEKAVRDWVFAPVVVEGKPQPAAVIFSARFWIQTAPSTVRGGVTGGVEGGVVGGVIGGVVGEVEPPVRAEGAVPPPKIVKKVDPLYPEVARQGRAEGVVILELTTDIYGRVMSAKVLRSIPLLDQAAIDAVRQCVYEPLVVDGRPRSCVFTATVRFVLK